MEGTNTAAETTHEASSVHYYTQDKVRGAQKAVRKRC